MDPFLLPTSNSSLSLYLCTLHLFLSVGTISSLFCITTCLVLLNASKNISTILCILQLSYSLSYPSLPVAYNYPFSFPPFSLTPFTLASYPLTSSPSEIDFFKFNSDCIIVTLFNDLLLVFTIFDSSVAFNTTDRHLEILSSPGYQDTRFNYILFLPLPG